MEEIVCLVLCIATIIFSKFIFKINYKKAKELEKNEDIQKITDKFPENIEIAKEMLEMLDNKSVAIEETKNTKTSLYIAVTDKITIADLKNNYGRIGTIAHECLHSVQDRALLMFNFMFSNFVIVYFILISILTITKTITNVWIQLFALLLFSFIGFAVRAYLEIDAMTKSQYLAKEYIEKKNICTKEEKDKIIKKYNEVNKMGIPFTIDYLFTNSVMRIIIYILLAIIFT